jgi:radical SAM protein (TIGR01212 family)
MRRFSSFGHYMRQNFGATVYKVNVDAGFTCPNRDGTLGVSGCIYCNNDSFKPNSCRPTMSVASQVEKGIDYVSKRYGARNYLVYFQPYTNTYAAVGELEALYREALRAPSVIGLAIGTRPDAVDLEKIEMIEALAADKFILIEYGLQSIYDKSLQFINRGHDYQAFLKALELTKNRGIFIGAHIIAGFPTETREETLAMAGEISSLPIQFLKIHQLQVVRDTPLEEMYKKEPFHTFDYDEYLDFIADFIERLSPEIVLQRLFATAPDNILLAPLWGRNRQQILRDIEKRLDQRDTCQGKKYKMPVAKG